MRIITESFSVLITARGQLAFLIRVQRVVLPRKKKSKVCRLWCPEMWLLLQRGCSMRQFHRIDMLCFLPLTLFQFAAIPRLLSDDWHSCGYPFPSALSVFLLSWMTISLWWTQRDVATQPTSPLATSPFQRIQSHRIRIEILVMKTSKGSLVADMLMDHHVGLFFIFLVFLLNFFCLLCFV